MCEVGTNAEQGEATLVKATRTNAIMTVFASERQPVGVKDDALMLPQSALESFFDMHHAWRDLTTRTVVRVHGCTT